MRKYSATFLAILIPVVGLPVGLSLTAMAERREPATFISIDFPGAIASFARGINRAGEIVGFYEDSNKQRHGYLLSGDDFTSIDFPGAVRTLARGISKRKFVSKGKRT